MTLKEKYAALLKQYEEQCVTLEKLKEELKNEQFGNKLINGLLAQFPKDERAEAILKALEEG